MSYIYVLSSTSTQLVKVGKAKCVEKRVSEINRVSYAGCCDWTLEEELFVGDTVLYIEKQIHKELRDTKVLGLTYISGDMVVGCNEVFSVTPSKAIQLAKSKIQDQRSPIHPNNCPTKKSKYAKSKLRNKVIMRINRSLGIHNSDKLTIRAMSWIVVVSFSLIYLLL